MPALAADDAPYGGTFSTPGYNAADNRNSTGLNAPTAPGQGNATGNTTNGSGQRQPTAPGTDNGLRPLPDANVPYAGTRRRDLLPPKPSEFQKFVNDATGRLLPLFGASFFDTGSEGFAPADNVPVGADYVVGPGDEVIVRAWGSIDVDYRTTVDRNGQVNLPKVGSFSVAGVKAADLERQLRAQIGRLYTNFNLNVTLGQLRGVKVFVVGPALRPGVYTLPGQSTLLSAIVAAGGPGSSGSMRKIGLRRDGKLVSELDVYDFLVQGDKSHDLQLVAGDVVVFQPAGPRIALTGALDTQGIYELKAREESLAEVLRYAGGAPVLANPNQAQLERIDPAQPKVMRFVEQFRLDAAGLLKPLRDGDVVTLLQISPQFGNAVTLKGHVAQPLRYAYTPGMRIHDLIPDRDALITPDFYRRKNLLVQMIDDNGPDAGDNAPGRRATTGGVPNANQGTATTSVNNADNGAQRNDLNNPNGAPQATAPIGTDTGGSMSPPARRTPGTQADQDALDDERAATERRRKRPAPLFDDLNWQYAVIERLNANDLRTEVIPFNLGAVVLRGDESQNLALLPGDVVTIYSQKDIRVPIARQTRLVSIEGEIGAPGIYQLQPGETLRGILLRAGGFTPQAYVYGLEFTREETRRQQRENLAAAIARLQALAATQGARDAANRRDDSGALTSAAVSSAATQAQLARLNSIQPNGRIALELNATDTSIDRLPDVPLDDGDRILVPPRPGFVTVAGAVANSNAFVWKPGRTVGDYIKLAGVDEAADASAVFILHADGTATSSSDQRNLFGLGGLQTTPLQPGDAVFVPSQLDYETFGRALVRNLKDFGLIFSQFGLGAAAIKTLSN